ncbi:Transposase [Paraburkholderia hospita]|nr:Transposase [Paraburkholderia hospita]
MQRQVLDRAAFYESSAAISTDSFAGSFDQPYTALSLVCIQTMRTPSHELPSTRRRMAAGVLLMDGVPPEEVAMRLGICMETLRKYRKRIAQGGLDALRKVGTAGRPTVLDDAAYSWIAASLKHSARLHGYDSDEWSNSRLREAISRRYGVAYSSRHIWKIAESLGLSWRLSGPARDKRGH